MKRKKEKELTPCEEKALVHLQALQIKEKEQKAKARAKKRGINFNLTLEWFEEQMKLSEFNYCAITGMEFVDGGLNHPFCRSLDRIDSLKGYTQDNVRWVCFKLNSWKSVLTLHEVSLIFKYMSESYGYDPIEYLRETIQQVL